MNYERTLRSRFGARAFRPVLLTVTLLIFAGTAQAGQTNKTFARDMAEALAIHDRAQSVGEEIEALEAFRKLSDRYTDEWLPPYWTAYLATQVARLESRVDDFPQDLDPKALVRESSKHLGEARQRAGEMDDTMASDFAVLEGLITNFYATIVVETDEEREAWREKGNQAYKQALRLNPRNPLMHDVLVGIQFFQEGRDSREVSAGLALLDHAEAVFNQAPNRALTTYWNKDFIPFWRTRGEARLAELLAEE